MHIINTLCDIVKKNKNLLFTLISFYMLFRRGTEVYFGSSFKNIAFFLVLVGIGIFLYEFFIIKKTKINDYENLFIILFLIYGIYIVFNGIWFGNLSRLFKGVKEYVYYPLILISSLFYIRNQKEEKAFFKMFIVISVLISIFSIYETLSGNPILPLEIDPYNKTRYYLVYGDTLIFRARTFFGSFQVNGVVLGIASLINLYTFHYEKDARYLIISIFNFIGLNCSCARGPLVAYIIALFFMIYFLYFKRLKDYYFNINPKSRIILLVLICVLLILLVFMIIFDINFDIPPLEFFFQRVRSIFNWSTTENSNTTRKGIWLKSLKIFMSNPVLGIGIASTGSGDIGTISIGVTESGVLKRLVETGIIGFGLYYLIIIVIIYSCFRSSGLKLYNFIKNNILYISILITIFIEDITLQITEDFVISFFLYFTAALICKNSNFLFRRQE